MIRGVYNILRKPLHTRGFAVVEFLVVVLVIGAIAAVGFAFLSRNELGGGQIVLKPNPEGQQGSPSNTPAPAKNVEKPPVLQNLMGLDFGPYSRSSQVSGDFIFSKAAAEQAAPGVSLLFYPFGQKLCTPKAECKTHDALSMNGLKLNTEVVAATDGQVSGLVKDGDEFTFSTVSNNYTGYSVGYAHIYKSTVKESMFIKAGDVIGKVSPYGDYVFGRVEMSVTKKATLDNPATAKLCPFDFLDPKPKPAITASMYQFMSDWNAFIGKDIHKATDMVTPGCMAKQISV